MQQARKKIASLEETIRSQQGSALNSAVDLDTCGRQKDELEQSRNKYRKLFNYANDAMFVISLDKNSSNYGYFSDVNNVACKRLGYTREELLQKTPFDISDGSDAEYNLQLVSKLYKEGHATFETIYVKKDGHKIPVEINALRLTIDGKDLYLAIARDITERKLSEAALRKSENLYRLLADNVHDVIWTTDHQMKPQYVSPSFSHLTGMPQTSAISAIHKEIIRPSPFIDNQQHLMSLSDDRPLHWECVLTTAEGDKLWVESIASPLPEKSNQFTGIIGVTRDITSRKKIMLELQAAKEQAFAANRAKSGFLANMSHEVRTPMNGVLGMLQLLKLTELSDEQLEYVETAMVSGESLLTIINDILDYSKIEAGKLQMSPEEFQLREIVSTVIRTFEASLIDRSVKISYSIAPNIPEYIIADPVRIRQIFYNLVGNAVKFTEKGEIIIEIDLLAALPDDRIQLQCTIADTGIGIPDTVCDSLFEPFTQVQSKQHTKIKGTGLGLSIVKQLVKQMNGTVKLGKNSRLGTTVIFTVEAGVGTQQIIQKKPAAPAPILTSPNRRLNTLVVEDETINRQILQAILTKLGHRSSIAEDGQTALALLKTQQFDIILMDVQMPHMDGMETTSYIRRHADYAHIRDIPIIALTAYAMAGDREKCLQAGMDSYLAKPVEIKALERLLKSLTIDHGSMS